MLNQKAVLGSGTLVMRLLFIAVAVTVALMVSCSNGGELTPTPATVQTMPDVTAISEAPATPVAAMPVTTRMPTATVVSPPASTYPAPTTPVASPASTPSPQRTADEAEQRGVTDYVRECETIGVSLDEYILGDYDDIELITWGSVEKSLNVALDLLGQLAVPLEIQALHHASYATLEALRDRAAVRPSEDSFGEEYVTAAAQLIEDTFEIGYDTTKTPEERKGLIEEAMSRTIVEIFGPGFVEASLALEEATAALPDDVLALLEGCDLFPAGGIALAGEAEYDELVDRIVHDDHGDFIEYATVIDVGEGIQGRINHPNDLDLFRFSAEAGQNYRVDLDRGSLDSAAFAVLDPTLSAIASNDDGNPLASYSFWTAWESGDHHILVKAGDNGNESTGSYSLTITLAEIPDEEDDHGNHPGNATLVAVGSQTQGSIDYRGDIDLFRIVTAPGQYFHVDVDVKDRWAGYSGKLQGRDAWGLESNERIFEVKAGRHSLVDTFSYTLTIFPDDYGNHMGEAAGVDAGSDIYGVLEYPGDSDFFRFEANAGQVYQLNLGPETSASEVYVRLTDHDGLEVASTAYRGDFVPPSFPWSVPKTGSYYLYVQSNRGTVGPYSLSIDLIKAEDDHGNYVDSATVVAVGVGTTGVLDYQNDTDFFRFTASEGQIYEIDVRLGTLEDSEVVLHDADGAELAYDNNSGNSLGSRILWAAPDSSGYHVAVRSAEYDSNDVGSYTLAIAHSAIQDDHGNHMDSATHAHVDRRISGSIDYKNDTHFGRINPSTRRSYDHQGDRDFFRFTASAGQLYDIGVELGSLKNPSILLRSPDGRVLEASRAEPRIFWVAPESGDYFVEVTVDRYGGSSTGSYILSISPSDIQDDHGDDKNDATAITVGTPTLGSIDYLDDTDFFRFSAGTGLLYQIDVASESLENSVAIRSAPRGSVLASNQGLLDPQNSRLFWIAPTSGEYYVNVQAAHWASTRTGAYSLTVAVSDIQDDHGNYVDSATDVDLETVTHASLDYPGDTDLFRFSGTPEQTYEIHVAPGTWGHVIVELLDSNGRVVADESDSTGTIVRTTDAFGNPTASTIYWTVPDMPWFDSDFFEYFVKVESWWGGEDTDSIGAYTLIISPTDAEAGVNE